MIILGRRVALRFVLLFFVGLTMTPLAAPRPAQALTPAQFTTPLNPLGQQPIGWAYAGNKFVGSVLGDGTGRLFSTDLTGGSIQPFGGTVYLNPNLGGEHFVASSLGLGGFPSRDVYVASGNNIQHIANSGVADPGLFVAGGLSSSVRGITFDAVGTWGYQMLVTTLAGDVYSVDPAGNPTLLANTGEDTEGLDVAPLGAGAKWGSQNGWLFVASEGSGSIRAIKPGPFAPGTHPVVTVATAASAEQLTFVPLNLGATGDPLEGLYSANFDPNPSGLPPASLNGQILKFAYTQFYGMEGDIIVTGETNGQIRNITATNGTNVTVSNVGVFPNQPEDGVFVTPAILTAPEPASLMLLGLGALLLSGRRSRR